MTKMDYEERIKELETQFRLTKERYQILAETTSALLFEYKPDEDMMIFNYNFPDNKSRKVIENYHEYMQTTPLVHPSHLMKFLDVLDKASRVPTRGEMEYLSRITSDEFQWHRTYYSSIADNQGKVISVLGRIHNVHQSTTERQEIIHRVETDFLTGLYNKRTATEKISKWLKDNPTREAQMILLGVNHFQEINDSYGYDFGDEVLKKIAGLLQNCFADEGVVARFGGVEFLIFLTDESVRQADSQVDELLKRIAKEIDNLDKPLKCSAGITSRVSKYDDFEDLFNRADNAMHMAKRAGENRRADFEGGGME